MEICCLDFSKEILNGGKTWDLVNIKIALEAIAKFVR